MWLEAVVTRLIHVKIAPIHTPATGVKARTLVMPEEAFTVVHGAALAATFLQSQKKTAPVQLILLVRNVPWQVAFAIGVSTIMLAML